MRVSCRPDVPLLLDILVHNSYEQVCSPTGPQHNCRNQKVSMDAEIIFKFYWLSQLHSPRSQVALNPHVPLVSFSLECFFLRRPLAVIALRSELFFNPTPSSHFWRKSFRKYFSCPASPHPGLVSNLGWALGQESSNRSLPTLVVPSPRCLHKLHLLRWDPQGHQEKKAPTRLLVMSTNKKLSGRCFVIQCGVYCTLVQRKRLSLSNCFNVFHLTDVVNCLGSPFTLCLKFVGFSQ